MLARGDCVEADGLIVVVEEVRLPFRGCLVRHFGTEYVGGLVAGKSDGESWGDSLEVLGVESFPLGVWDCDDEADGK